MKEDGERARVELLPLQFAHSHVRGCVGRSDEDGYVSPYIMYSVRVFARMLLVTIFQVRLEPEREIYRVSECERGVRPPVPAHDPVLVGRCLIQQRSRLVAIKFRIGVFDRRSSEEPG